MKFTFTAPAQFIGFFLLSAILLSFSLSSCAENDEPNDNQAEWLVVEGYIDTDGYPYVILTTSLHPTTKPQPIAPHVVRWGKVSISDGDTTIIMTGGVDNRYFPPFAYSTYYMKGLPGKSYTIEAEYNGLKAHAETTLLSAPNILGYTLEKIDGADSLRSLKVDISLSENDIVTENYFLAFMRNGNTNDQFTPCFMGTQRLDAGTLQASLPIFQSKTIISNADRFIPNFILGDTVDIMIAHIDRPSFDFWNEFLNQIDFGNSIFMSSSNSPIGNITGGYGCFTGRGAAKLKVIIKD